MTPNARWRLREAAAAWVADACRVLASHPPLKQYTVVTEVHPKGYKTQEEARIDLAAAGRASTRLGLPSFDPLLDAVIRGREWFEKLPNGQGDATRGWVELFVAAPLFDAYLREARAVEFKLRAFDAVCARLERELAEGQTDYSVNGPVRDLELTEPVLEPVPGIRLRQSRREDLEEWLNREVSGVPVGGLNVRVALEHPYVQPSRGPAAAREAQERVMRLMTSIQLHANCDASPVFIHFRRDGVLQRGPGGIVTVRSGFGTRPGTIGAADASALRELFDCLEEGTVDPALGIALDRWRSIAFGQKPEATLVDSWVGLESLLFRSGGGEIRYRASLRLAALIGRDADDRRLILGTARRSYDARSHVIHGADPRKIEVATHAAESRDYLRRALLAGLRWPGVFDPEQIESRLLA